MVIIQKGSASTIYIALFDKRLTGSDTYTFLFQHEVTKEEVTLILADVSEHKERYSEFNILLASFQNSTVGFWRYYVTQAGSGANIIATGKMELTAANLSTSGVIRYDGYNGEYKTYTTIPFVQPPVPTLLVEAWNSANNILDADTSANTFIFSTDVIDLSGLWTLDKFVPNQTGTYRIEVDQPVRNNFSVGVQPKVPQIKNITTLQYTEATWSENWPTEYVNFNWIYEWTAEYNINVTTIGHQFQLQLFNYAEGEASITQLGAPGIIKIYKTD